MIYSLRRKLIWISGISVISVFIIIFAVIYIVSTHQLNSAMDTLTDRIASNDGIFPEIDEEHPPPRALFDFITEETKFSIRFFTVRYDRSDNIDSADIEFVASVTEETARIYAEEAVNRNGDRGWLKGYRYKVYQTSMGQAVVFVDGNMNRSITSMLLIAVGVVLILSLVIILILIIVFSKRAVKPVAESYEKQKQFITDAENFSLSDAVTDTISEFQMLSEEKRKPIKAAVRSGMDYYGDEAGIRRVISILLDNALKYCDPGGEIFVSLTGKHHPVICVENTCSLWERPRDCGAQN